MRLASEMIEAPGGSAGQTPAAEPRPASDAPPIVASPPIAPQSTSPHSPWWTAPAGKGVDIPAFGRALLDQILAMLYPAPQPIPLRIRVKR